MTMQRRLIMQYQYYNSNNKITKYLKKMEKSLKYYNRKFF